MGRREVLYGFNKNKFYLVKIETRPIVIGGEMEKYFFDDKESKNWIQKYIYFFLTNNKKGHFKHIYQKNNNNNLETWNRKFKNRKK